MRKLLSILLALSMVFTLAACGKGESTDGEMDGKGDKATANEDSATGAGAEDDTDGADTSEVSIIDTLSKEVLAKKYEEFNLLTESNEAVVRDITMATTEIEGTADIFQTGMTGDCEIEIKERAEEVFSEYVSGDDPEIYSEFYIAILQIGITEGDNEFYFVEKMFETENDGYTYGTEEFASAFEKKLSENIPAWSVELMIFDMYGGMFDDPDEKQCVKNQYEIYKVVSQYLAENNIQCTAKQTIYVDASGSVYVNEYSDSETITAEEFEALFATVPRCSTNGRFEVYLMPSFIGNTTPSVVVNCCDDTGYSLHDYN